VAVVAGLLRVFAASAVSGVIAWFIEAQENYCNPTTEISDFASVLASLLLLLPAASGFVFSLRPYSAAVCFLGGMTASGVVVVVATRDAIHDAASGGCEPGPALFAVLLMPLTFLVLVALLLVLRLLGIRSTPRNNAAKW
jgi:hypothetical protein